MIEIHGSPGKSEIVEAIKYYYRDDAIIVSTENIPFYGDRTYIYDKESFSVEDLDKFLNEDWQPIHYDDILIFYSDFDKEKIQEYLKYFKELEEKRYLKNCIVMYKD